MRPIDISSNSDCNEHDVKIEDPDEALAEVDRGDQTPDWPRTPIRIMLTNEDQRIKYHDLRRRLLLPHKFLCSAALETLGITNDVELLIRRLRLENYLYEHVPTYAEFTFEFWSSLAIQSISDITYNLLTFRMNGRSYAMTRDDINNVCGFNMNGNHQKKIYEGRPWGTGYEHLKLQFKNEICHMAALEDQNKSVTIISLVLRYIQKLVAILVHGQPDNSTFTREDTWMLYTMIYNNSNPGILPCIASIICRSMKIILQRGFYEGTKIPYGNLITRIAKYKQVFMHYCPDTMHCLDSNPRHLDVARLFHARFLEVANGMYYHLIYDKRLVRLPWPIRISCFTLSWNLPSLPDYFPDISADEATIAPVPDPDREAPCSTTKALYDLNLGGYVGICISFCICITFLAF